MAALIGAFSLVGTKVTNQINVSSGHELKTPWTQLTGFRN
jgi:hypothetical protein